jgi:hypothetical protein
VEGFSSQGDCASVSSVAVGVDGAQSGLAEHARFGFGLMLEKGY